MKKRKDGVTLYFDGDKVPKNKNMDIQDLKVIGEELIKQLIKLKSCGCDMLFDYKDKEYIIEVSDITETPECNGELDND